MGISVRATFGSGSRREGAAGGGRARLLALLGLALVAGGAAAVQVLGDQPPAWYPRCWFHVLTDLHCPGCGTARAMHALLSGDVLRAVDQNLFSIAMLPLLMAWAGVAFWRGAVLGRPAPSLPGGAARLVLILVLAFVVLRNLPWWPLTVLAPD